MGTVADKRLPAVQVSITAHNDNPHWRNDAACRGLDPNVFHPKRGRDTNGPKDVCGPCPVKTECLAYSLVNFEKHGIWGGLSERERRVIRGQLTRAGKLQPPLLSINHGTSAGYHAHRRRGEQPCRLCMEARNAAESHFADSA
jgi:WhiB family redox-sensing transcriptional regulator